MDDDVHVDCDDDGMVVVMIVMMMVWWVRCSQVPRLTKVGCGT